MGLKEPCATAVVEEEDDDKLCIGVELLLLLRSWPMM